MKFSKNEKPVIIVFRTTIKTESNIKSIAHYLNNHNAISRWNVDLEDRESILRIEAKKNIQVERIIDTIQILGYDCEELE